MTKKAMPTRKPAVGNKNTSVRTFDAFPDKIDLRDWPYQPTLKALPDTIVNCADVPAILDQGNQGACTGFALAAVINYLLHNRKIKRFVSPRMLYEMARCYDEWPGENYDGSSARGAMKGWASHGVCTQKTWPNTQYGRSFLNTAISLASLDTPCGAYYRVQHNQIRDMHAALSEVGILYATLMVHDGWEAPGPNFIEATSNGKKIKLPVIQRSGRADDGHAVAIVGYTAEGFIIQNSWGVSWGFKGFALLPYEDYLLHTTDVWVAQLGVPVAIDLWNPLGMDAADTNSGLHRAARNIPISEIRPYVIDIGNNGELSQNGDYWTTEDDIERLFKQTIPDATADWGKKRVMLYIHGGLNSEQDSAKRVIAYRDVCLANNIYPLHIMWETSFWETVRDIMGDLFDKANERAGGGFMDGMLAAKNRLLEITAAPIGGPVWAEMKENAWRASYHRNNIGGMQLIAKNVKVVLNKLSDARKKDWELHIITHSAGSIFAAYAMSHLVNLGIPINSIQFFAPAIRIDEFKKYMLPLINGKGSKCPRPTLYILNEEQEAKDPSMKPYGKSLLWLVSNAFEDSRGTALLGMQKFLNADSALNKFLSAPISGLPGVVTPISHVGAGAETASTTHGGFDNDVATMNSALYRILGKAPTRLFTKCDLQFE